MKSISTQAQKKYAESLKAYSGIFDETLENIVSHRWSNITNEGHLIKRLERSGNFDEIDSIIKSKSPIVGRELYKGPEETINKIFKEAIIDNDEIIPSIFLHKGSFVARCVGRIINTNSREPLATGFLVSPNVLLTNNHVISSIKNAEECSVEFDYYSDESGNSIESKEFRFNPRELFITSDEHVYDYSLIAVEPENKKAERLIDFGFIKLIGSVGKVVKGERLNIIHHPKGKPQQISIRKNLLISHNEDNAMLNYITDTMTGSSGSPVFNDDWELVALHRASEETNDEKKKELFYKAMYSDKKGAASVSEDEVIRFNLGVRISAIVNDIKSQLKNVNADKRELLNGVINSKVLSFVDNVRTFTPTIRDQSTVNAESNFEHAAQNITINIGSEKVQFETANCKNSVSLKSSNEPDLEIYNIKLNNQKSVFKALSYLEKSRERDYLPDSNEIEKRKVEYYKEVFDKFEKNVSASEAFNLLYTLKENTFTLVSKFPLVVQELEGLYKQSNESIQLEGGISYAKARAHLYTWVDLQEDRMLKGVYTQCSIAPEQLLLKDLITSMKVDVDLPDRYNNNEYLNCEHIVPQSLFNRDKNGVSDLHHLICADGAANKFRSNRPYRVIGSSGEEGPKRERSYIKSSGKREGKVFEPNNNKGLVARATLYFIVAYKDMIALEHYDKDAITTLIEWSNNEAPSIYELHRNEAIYEIQGNRNPFIDYPDWVYKVDFSKGLII